MEKELKLVGTVPSGIISSKLFHDLLENISDDEAGSTSAEDRLFVSLCTSGALLAIVTSSCGAQFSSEEDTRQEDELSVYKNSFQGYLDVPKDTLMGVKLKIRATAVTVLPIQFNRGDKPHRASVVLVGFSNGYVYGYSMSGQTIFSKQIHEDSVTQLTFMSPSLSRRHESLVTLAILCGSIVCIIEGWSLVQVIQNNVDKMNRGSGWSEYDEDMPRLTFKKWDLKDQSIINAIAFLGHTTVSMYDYLCEASKVTGFESSIRSVPSAEAQIVSVGQQPMIALYKINKDAGQVNMSKVMQAVASKTLNAVMGRISKASGWLGWGGQKKEDEQQQTSKSRKLDESLYESSDLHMDCNLPDARRTVVSVSVSPLGDLAALVDGFGRVLLLDCQTFTIRRMWKGYRDAQCGWKIGRDDISRKKNTEEKGSQVIQFLCIYAARRGILEVWPSQYGKRLKAFHIGKGCQILYSSCETFSFGDVTVSSTNRSSSEKPKFHCFTMVLTPQGELLSFSVPHGLSSEEDPRSLDRKVLKNLSAANESGNIQDVFEGVSKLKLTSSLKHAIDSLLRRKQQLSFDIILSIIGIAMKKLQPHKLVYEASYQYLMGCQQILQLLLTLDKLKQEDRRLPTKLSFNEFLNQAFEVPEVLAVDLTRMLEKYYEAYEVKSVVQDVSFYDIIQCFKLPSDVGNHLLNPIPVTESEPSSRRSVSLQLSAGTENCLEQLGCKILLPLLTRNVIPSKMKMILEKSLISKKDLMILLCHLFLSGTYTAAELTLLHQCLYDLSSAILQIKDACSLHESFWVPICRQCAITCNVGHALSIVLIYQRLTSESEKHILTDVEGVEDWESVSAEKSHWATLYTNLEVLVHLSNIVGSTSLKLLPVVPIYDLPEDSSNPDVIAADLVKLQFQLFDRVYKEGNMSAACLKNGGPSLVTQCLCEWIVKKKIRPEIIVTISTAFPELTPLVKSLPSSLGSVQLLVHSVWQACYVQDDYYTGLHYLSQLTDPKVLSGTIGMLWCSKFERTMYLHIENYKKGTSLDGKAMELISVCRILFGYLYQLCFTKPEDLTSEPHQEETGSDAIIFQVQNRKDLMYIVEHFPVLNSTVVCTYFELLLLFEVSLQLQDGSTNLLAYFPNWLRNSVKKGLYKSAWQEQVPQQLQQKRIKLLKDAVCICVHKEAQPVMTPSLNSHVNFGSTHQVDIAEYQEFVFLLCRLWKISLDHIVTHWVANLFAVGLFDLGKKILLEVEEKSSLLHDVLSLSGHMTDLLIQNMDKSIKLTVLAQTPPTLLEWTRKQGSLSAVKNCIRIKPSCNSLSQIMSFIIPYLPQGQKDKAVQLEAMIKFMK